MLIILLSLACGQGTEPKSFEIADVDDTVSLADTESGAYALKVVTSALMANPFNHDERTPSVTTSRLLVSLTRDGTALAWSEVLCAVSSTETYGNLIEYPAAFIETMPVRERTGQLSSSHTGATLSLDPYVDVNGAALDEPWSDPLPAAPDDSSVVDQDRDGEPGITLSVTNALLGQGDIYAAQRQQVTMSGQVVADGRIEGYIEADSEQAVLGASVSWLTISVAPPIPDPDPTHSYFILQRLSTDTPGCGDVWGIE